MARLLASLIRCTVTTALLFCLVVSPAFAKTEQDVKAAYLYNFIKFIDWPESLNQGDHNLCLLGRDSIHDKLKKLDQKEVKKKILHIVSLHSVEDLPEGQCSIVFVGQSEGKFLKEVFAHTGSTPTLTVSSIDDFAESGGTIGFIKLGNVIRFNINLGTAKQSQISISAKLLELANKVVK